MTRKARLRDANNVIILLITIVRASRNMRLIKLLTNGVLRISSKNTTNMLLRMLNKIFTTRIRPTRVRLNLRRINKRINMRLVRPVLTIRRLGLRVIIIVRRNRALKLNRNTRRARVLSRLIVTSIITIGVPVVVKSSSVLTTSDNVITRRLLQIDRRSRVTRVDKGKNRVVFFTRYLSLDQVLIRRANRFRALMARLNRYLRNTFGVHDRDVPRKVRLRHGQRFFREGALLFCRFATRRHHTPHSRSMCQLLTGGWVRFNRGINRFYDVFPFFSCANME